MADTFVVDKEGQVQVFSKRKWAGKWAMLVGGGLYFKKRQDAYEAKGPVLIKGSLVESTEEFKKKLAVKITVTAEDDLVVIALSTEEERKSWVSALMVGSSKEIGALSPAIRLKLSQSRSMALKKNLGGTVATSAGGKSIIKEFLGKDSVEIINIIKSLITTYETKKKAVEIENNIIRLGTKVILLWKNHDIKGNDFVTCVPKLKELWTNLIHYCEIPFSYDVAGIQKLVGELRDIFTKLLGGKITEKNMNLLKYTLDYLVDQKLLDLLFDSDDHEEMKKDLGKILRESWALVFTENQNNSKQATSEKEQRKS